MGGGSGGPVVTGPEAPAAAWWMAVSENTARKMVEARRERDEAVRLLKYALHLRMHGERAPGGNETWQQFDRDAEAYLRSPAPWSQPDADPLGDVRDFVRRQTPPIPVEAGQTYLVNLAAGTLTPVRDRDHAGLGLPCGPCVGACRFDDEGPAS